VRRRLDTELVRRGLATSREVARGLDDKWSRQLFFTCGVKKFDHLD